MYTRVLMGHIDLARTILPYGTTDTPMDFAARQPQYQIGRNYGHGTGHGIGSYLSVHEGPQAVGNGGAVLNSETPTARTLPLAITSSRAAPVSMGSINGSGR